MVSVIFAIVQLLDLVIRSIVMLLLTLQMWLCSLILLAVVAPITIITVTLGHVLKASDYIVQKWPDEIADVFEGR